jgi:hypothetical protein
MRNINNIHNVNNMSINSGYEGGYVINENSVLDSGGLYR